jgi:hypothetical protein
MAAACTAVQSGSARPSLANNTSGPQSSPPETAPTVKAPLALTILSNNPCGLLTPTQLSTIGLTQAATTQRDQSSLMQGCEWSDSTVGTGVQLGVAWVPAFRHGLADIYAQRRTAAYWQPVTQAGYPGVLNDTIDERGTGTCRMDLGVSNTAVLDLSYQDSAVANPCGKVEMLAMAVVSSLKGGS